MKSEVVDESIQSANATIQPQTFSNVGARDLLVWNKQNKI